MSAEDSHAGRSSLPSKELFECLVAIIGFSGYYLWDLSGVFMFATPFAFSLRLVDVIGLRLCWLIALTACLALARLRAAEVLRRRADVLGGGLVLFLVPLGVGVINAVGEGVAPEWLGAAAWLAYGVAQAALMLYWALYFSLTPTRYTPVTIAVSSCVGTVLFIGVSNMESVVLGLLATGFAAACSFGLLFLLMRGVSPQRLSEAEKYTSISSFTVKSAFSVGAHGIAFGFSTTMLFTLGVHATVIGCASGIVGSLLSLAWFKIGRKTDIDIGVLQRLTLPPVVIGLLLMPFGGSFWQLLCCCLVNIALSLYAVAGWINSTTANSEFSLHPVGCTAARQLPVWIGFFVGTVVAGFAADFSGDSRWQFMAIVVGIVSVIVCAIAAYGMDDSMTKKRLSELLTQRTENVRWAQEEDKATEQFEERFDELMKSYDLSPREVEVFRLLAKGRNADYISDKLIISNSTAKSHIYHIYRKMGINSQQSLIDAVEEYDRKSALSKKHKELTEPSHG